MFHFQTIDYIAEMETIEISRLQREALINVEVRIFMERINMSNDSEFIPVENFIDLLFDMGGINIHRSRSLLKFQLGTSLVCARISKDGLVDSKTLKRLGAH